MQVPRAGPCTCSCTLACDCVCDKQVLPFASEETLQRLEANIAAAPSITEMLHEGLAPKDIAARIFDGLGASDGGPPLVPRCATQPKGVAFCTSHRVQGRSCLYLLIAGDQQSAHKGSVAKRSCAQTLAGPDL